MRHSIWISGPLALIVLLISVLVWINGNHVRRTNVSLSAARRALQRGDFTTALRMSDQLLADRDDSACLLIAGEAAARLNKFDEAVSYYDRVPDSPADQAAVARWAAGEVTLQLRQMTPSIERMRQALEFDPYHVSALQRLIYLLNLSGQRWEALPLLQRLVQQGQGSAQELLYLGNLAKSIENEAELSEFLTASPNDSLPHLGVVRILLRQGKTEEAQNRLLSVLAQQPQLVEAHVQLGKLYVQTALERMPDWNQSLPLAADQHPDIWYVRGEWNRALEQTALAARCYAEALMLDPDHVAALSGLAPALHTLGKVDAAQQAVARTTLLQQFLSVLERIMADEWAGRRALQEQNLSATDYQLYLKSDARLQPILTATRLTNQLGRSWESLAWAQYGLSSDPGHRQLLEAAQLAQQQLNSAPASQTLRRHLIDLTWLHSLGLPEWQAAPSLNSAIAGAGPSRAGRELSDDFAISFEEVPTALNFEYYASRDSFDDGRRMFEMTGGGVGVLDFDRDGWPDIFLAQGCPWPPSNTSSTYGDRLLRNLGARRVNPLPAFGNCSHAAGIAGEQQFGQGVAIGDVNSDGFDDIYVCNFGPNQLWLNQGDGTFWDGSAVLQVRDSSWTVSAAIADLNGDGVAEIFDANYVAGDDVTTRRCLNGGKPRACGPLNFKPAPAQLLAADEQGIFRSARTDVVDAGVRDGYALGVVVFRRQTEQWPSIFVANDQVANVLLVARADANAPLGIRLQDQAIVDGMAFDREGRSQACMGVATGDVNADGALDLFVTNYHDESNTLYIQQPDGSFYDATGSSGLAPASLPMLGFGTQLIDAQLDGWGDLLTLNGHIDDLTHRGIPYHMPAQLFEGQADMRFQVRSANEIGEYFRNARLGRALAWMDFDRDGRQDFVATELDGPTRLLRNTSKAGNYLAISLTGTVSQRDAIGAQVTVSVGSRSWTQQLIAGCGYMATNQRTLHFGLGAEQEVDQIDIHWPSGLQQTFGPLKVNSRWLVVEERGIQPLP